MQEIRLKMAQAAKDQQNKKYREALLGYNEILNQTAINTELRSHALLNKALCLRFLGLFDESIGTSFELLKILPDNIATLNNLGAVYIDIGQLDLAKKQFEKILSLNENYAPALCQLAVIAKETRDFVQAVTYFQTAKKITPEDYRIDFHLGLLDFKSSDFATAWNNYEARLKSPNYAYLKNYRFPLWQGENLAGKKILIVGEQGLGDQLLASTVLDDVIKAAGTVLMATDERLVSIFTRRFPKAHFAGLSENGFTDFLNEPEINYHAPLFNVVGILRDKKDKFKHVSPLAPDPQLALTWNKKLSKTGNNLKIGVSWRSFLANNNVDTALRLKASTQLCDWKSLLSLPNATFVNLQYGPVSDEIRESGHLTDFSELDKTRDIENLAALISNLDLVISINSTAAMLSAALGIPTWILRDFAYGNDFEPECDKNPHGSLWFENVTYFRQSSRGDWSAAVESVVNALRFKNNDLR